MESEKVLSVSIAAYNVEKFIKSTLDSFIIEEPYRSKLDVIVVNDGSKDKTLEIAKHYADMYPECIRYIDKDNGGYGSTINASLAVAKGRYYKLLDGDDWYDKKGLRDLLDYLETTDADLVISPYYEVYDGTGKQSLVEQHPEIPQEPVLISDLRIQGELWFRMHGLTIKTEVLRKFSRPITEKCFYTDFEFMFYCVMASQSITRFGQAVYCYRLGLENQSVSLAGMRKHYADYLPVSKKIFACYDEAVHELRGTKKNILEGSVTFYTYCIFNTYMLLADPVQHRNELKDFDAMIRRNYPAAWQAGLRSRVVSVTRKLNFRFYRLLCSYMLWKLKNGK